MKATRNHSERVVIVGGGVSGLSIAHVLAQAGLPVTVLEASRPGFGASTRNQGWLHAGGWFAPDHPQLARMCYESAQQTIGFCPDCVEQDREGMAFIVSRSDSDPARWADAWRAAHIPFQELPKEDLLDAIPHLNADAVNCAFRLPDRAFRPDILVEHMAAAAETAGAEIRCGVPVTELLIENGIVNGVQSGSGESIFARVVILAGNASGANLWPAGGRTVSVGPSDDPRVCLKTHLLAINPCVSRLPFCVIDSQGLNHIPHGPKSVFGSNRWEVVANPTDQCVDAPEVVALTERIGGLFPGIIWERHTTTAWAGTTVQAMHVDQITPGDCPLPTVIDHEFESPSVSNLLSVFPGRATLWPQLAEKTRVTVLNRLDRRAKPVSRPHWDRGVPIESNH